MKNQLFFNISEEDLFTLFTVNSGIVLHVTINTIIIIIIILIKPEHNLNITIIIIFLIKYSFH